MSELIPSISFTEFKKLKADEVKQLKACEVTSDGVYLFTAVIPPASDDVIYDNVKVKAEYLAHQGNTVGGLTLDQIKGEVASAAV